MKNNNANQMSIFSTDRKSGQVIEKLIFPLGLAIVYVFFDFLLGGGVLLQKNAFLTLISHTVIQAYIAWGLIFVFSGGPDFSIAGAMVLSANVGAVAVTDWHLGYFGLFFFCITVTIVLQILASFVRIKFKLPTWVSGLAMLMIYEAIGAVYTTSRSARGLTTITLGADQCRVLGRGAWPIGFLIVGTIIMHFVFSNTEIGISYRASSVNPVVAGYMGINSKKSQYIAAIVGAVSVGIAAALTMSTNAKLDTYTGLGSISVIGKALATWLLAGAMEKRLSKPVCILLGAFFTAFLFNVMTRLNVPSGTWQDVANAGFILVFGALSFAGTKEVVK